jgi:hypothetical protein
VALICFMSSSDNDSMLLNLDTFDLLGRAGNVGLLQRTGSHLAFHVVVQYKANDRRLETQGLGYVEGGGEDGYVYSLLVCFYCSLGGIYIYIYNHRESPSCIKFLASNAVKNIASLSFWRSHMSHN